MCAYVAGPEFHKRKAKSQMRSEMVSRGLWTDFVRERERLKDEGVTPERAWLLAYDLVDNSHPAAADIVDSEVKRVESVSRPTRQAEVLDASKEVFAEKTCSTPKTVEWVAANIRVSDPSPEDAPSSEAWSMLCWVKGSPQAESQFWGQIYTKLLPTRQQLDQDSRMEDDGRRVLTLIDRIKGFSDDAKEMANGQVEQTD